MYRINLRCACRYIVYSLQNSAFFRRTIVQVRQIGDNARQIWHNKSIARLYIVEHSVAHEVTIVNFLYFL